MCSIFGFVNYGDKVKGWQLKELVKALSIEVLESANLTEDYTAVKPVHAKLGPAFKADAKAIVAEIAKLDPKAVAADLAKDGKVKVSVNGSEIELTESEGVYSGSFAMPGQASSLVINTGGSSGGNGGADLDKD